MERFNHAGLSWWQDPDGRTLGHPTSTPDGKMYTRLLGDRDAAVAAVAPGASPALQGEWADFIAIVTGARRRDGQPTPIERLATPHGQEPIFLPGFDPAAGGGLTIRVLAPVEFTVGGKPASLDFQSMQVTSSEVLAGSRRGKARTHGFAGRQIVTGLIYGLVNVRTDGSKILCATLDEAEDDWRIETFSARF